MQFGKEPVEPWPKPGSTDHEALMRSMLDDPRLRPPRAEKLDAQGPHRRWRLDHLPSLDAPLRCDVCRIGHREHVGDLIHLYGADANCSIIAGKVMPCPQRAERGACRAYFVRG